MTTIRPLTHKDLAVLWKIAFTETKPEWKQWDAPYFDDYRPMTYDLFEQQLGDWLLSDQITGIFDHDTLIGMASRNWENRATRWLEIGIVIYQPKYWNGGHGAIALRTWITQTFAAFPEIQHIGLTTWSGNQRMMALAQKLGLKQEARIRQVRYWQGVYYDSMKYGVLRDEWESLQNQAK